MTTAEERRLHERLDDIAGDLAEVKTSTGIIAARCQVCQPIVMGNGGRSIDVRVARLETIRQISGKGFWALVALISTIVAGVVVAAVAVIGKVAG